MKRTFAILLLSAWSTGVFAQCNQFYALNKGTTWQISNFNAKGKLQGKTIQEVTAYSENMNGYVATLKITSIDDKGEQFIAGTSTLKCEDGVMYFDLENLFPDAAMKSVESFEAKIDGTNLELPNNLNEGDVLKDAELNMSIDADPLKLNFQISVTDRKVEAMENLKTPAGTFDCFKISQKVFTKTMGKFESNTKEWYAKNVGMVKSESYNKKGKLMSYSLLTTYKE